MKKGNKTTAASRQRIDCAPKPNREICVKPRLLFDQLRLDPTKSDQFRPKKTYFIRD
jgi:hypothetical protein